MNADVHALTGAYVLDAVSDDERQVFERHLGDCDACRQEVTELRETAARLGVAAAAAPPPRLKSSVMAQIHNTRQLPPDAAPDSPTYGAPVVPLHRRSSPVALRLSAAAAAVLLVVSGVLGVLLYRTQSNEQVDPQAAAIAAIVRSGDAQVINQGDAQTGRMTALVSSSADRMVLVSDDMPAAPSGKTYQAWTIGEQVRSAGLIEPAGGKVALDVHGLADAKQVGVTVEPAGGSNKPTTTPFLVFDVA